MAKYLIQGSFTDTGTKGLVHDGGSRRREAVSHAIESVGGRIEAFYFAFGGDDVVIIFDVPTHAAAAALSIAAAASGAFRPRITVLLTPEELDTATKMKVDYRAPGH